MRVGIISFAHMHAYSYASALLQMPDVELVAIADVDEDRGQLAAHQFHTEYYRDYVDMLNRASVDAVVVCTENKYHKDAVISAAQAKKHILCEKPIATTVDDAWSMIRECERNGVKLQTAFPVRFSLALHRVKDMVDKGSLGRVVSLVGTNRGTNPGGWFTEVEISGGGAVLDHTVHVIDIMRWLLQSEVREVYAEIGTRFSDLDCDDCGLLMLEFENGVYASHDPSWSRCSSFSTWGDVTMEVIGTGGVSRVNVFGQSVQLYDNQIGKMVERPWGDDLDNLLVQSFVDCVRNDTPPVISGLDGLRAMQVGLAAYESQRTGRPVRIER